MITKCITSNKSRSIFDYYFCIFWYGALISIKGIVETDETLKQSATTIDKYGQQLDNFKLTIANAFRYNDVNEFVDVISTQIRDVSIARKT